MTPARGWNLPPDLLAWLARRAARKPRRVQREEYRARMLARAQANWQACGPIGAARPDGAPPHPLTGVS